MAKVQKPAIPSENILFFQDFYQRLQDVGFGSKQHVRRYLLPDWWCDEFEQRPGARVEAAAYVSRRTGLAFEEVMESGRSLTLAEGPTRCYKLRQGTATGSLAIARALGEQVAQQVAHACPTAWRMEGLGAQEIRDIILTHLRANDIGITLEGLLAFCWQRGIPVVPLCNLPSGKGKKKFDGMVGQFNGRPVIAIGLQHQSPARVAFVLAHELGHIAAGHVTKGMSIVDEQIHPKDGEDEQEVAADRFAVELIYGRAKAAYRFPGELTPANLTKLAIDAGVRDRVHPASVALNYAWLMDKKGKQVWGFVTKVLKQLEENTPNAPEILSKYLKSQLNWEVLSDDNCEFLERMTNVA